VAPKARFRPADSRKRRALAVIGWDCRSETAARVLCEKIAALGSQVGHSAEAFGDFDLTWT
jgi:hypothetical protein